MSEKWSMGTVSNVKYRNTEKPEAQIHTGNGFGALRKERSESAPSVMSSAVVRTEGIGTGTVSNVMYRMTNGSDRDREGEA